MTQPPQDSIASAPLQSAPHEPAPTDVVTELPPGQHLVLASQSESRRALLQAAGIEPRVHASGVDEEAALAAAEEALGEQLAPDEVALTLARAKCEAVADELAEDADAWVVIGCDSVLEIDGESFGKPGTPEVATERWRAMRGRAGVLHSGHWLVDLRDTDPEGEAGSGATLGAVSSTTLHFADVTDEEIDAYVATGEPLHVAGAFTLEGRAGAFITRVEGEPSGVQGLSLPVLRELLDAAGLGIHELWG
ncbi:septum formation protein [Kytococcus aerolatus]|uniref:Nucleoside triphosphate pyrophosphatase n=1 Tax=Kytococcus aerolatus TaxID=592308 RepID=A0A212TZK1_9MICO|nr:Maf family protein [Kytococcus aerolatus]SNC71409.1 septum formation protein [Kytococcus aerolatus]